MPTKVVVFTNYKDTAARNDVMEAHQALWEKLHQWRQEAPPTEAVSRPRVIDAVRTIRQTAASADLETVMPRLRALWEGICAEDLDRPFRKPEERLPSVRDLEPACWELVVTKKMPVELQEGGHVPRGEGRTFDSPDLQLDRRVQPACEPIVPSLSYPGSGLEPTT